MFDLRKFSLPAFVNTCYNVANHTEKDDMNVTSAYSRTFLVNNTNDNDNYRAVRRRLPVR